MLLCGEVACFADVTAGIGGSAIDFERDALCGGTRHSRFDLAGNIASAALKFRAELGGDAAGAILIGLFKRSAHGAPDRCRDHDHTEKDGRSEQEKKFLAETHRVSASIQRSE